MGNIISSFHDLRVYQAAFDLQQQVFVLSKGFPKEERYALTDQIRRASRSVGANIAEAWQKRRYNAHFLSKLTDADGGLAETQHWLGTARACDYLAASSSAGLIADCLEIGRMLGSMMAKPDKFCHLPLPAPARPPSAAIRPPSSVLRPQ